MNNNLFFRDMFSHIDGGVHAQTLAIGTTSGSPIAIGGSAGAWNKVLFRLLAAKGGGNAGLSLYLQTATASAGPFASLSQTLASVSVSTTSAYVLEVDTRMEKFCDLGTGPLWVQPVVAVATTATPVALDVLGWSCDYEPARNSDTGGVIVTEVDFY